jgi:hypothetical protein
MLAMDSSIPPTAVHTESFLTKHRQPVAIEMVSTCHRTHNPRKHQEVLLFATEQWLELEERNYLGQEVLSVPDHIDQCRISCSTMVLLDPSTPEPTMDQVEDLSPVGILTDMELRDELPATPCMRVALDCNVERSFSVHIPSDVCIQSFLLVVRTGQIVTVHLGPILRMGADRKWPSTGGCPGVSSI